MKKNKIFTLGLVITFVFVVSLTLVSGTFAKYTSTVTGNDSASVAKWAFQYGTSEGTLSDVDLSSTKIIAFNLFDTILDTNGDPETDVATDKIAPGTKGSFQFVVKNTSEVNATFDLTLEVTGAQVPFEYTIQVNEENASEASTTVPSLTTQTIDMNTSVTVTITWEWPFDGNDTTDTTLGLAASTVEVNATIVFVQVD